ncbi:MAG: hypothetical protein UV82_C0005G0004 [Candidatus Magasanikbacteria bacterium GW2011_GWD2_43_18]|nr:MAG: hypothetical protein UV18_C0005G0186 [Candidatus Magasanikbacteria bacterium GW2011_GWC2_42_27]KKT04766.1 MAG: hypothetical protein UV82_C0005G0004 [Candidatus Magasanikbacteria bacterium GW2011_GWD2_43_18]KKT25877.1 MAG: hypothetical protein UW10_C0003G0038 [Candidatus Magasanikbacteria bacterium GW2011_GWA2_43_9]HBB37857.1 hypothetical protein [Candidatus Magasanikbacteria bacterium]HCC13472.1 hypothetical protein [Candidatus Magasanikbacteria bacterium]
MQKFHIGSLSALLITATFLTGAGCTAETSVGTVVELTPTTEFSSTGNTEEGVPYSFQGTVPQDWTEHEDKDPRVLGQIYSPTTAEDPFQENINVARFDFAPGEKEMTFDEFSAVALQGIETYKGYKLVSQTKREVSGYQAITISFQTTEYLDGSVMQLEQTFLRTEKEGYVITFTGTPEGALQYEKVYTDFLDSMIIE